MWLGYDKKDLICKLCQYQAKDIYDYDGQVWSEICTDPTVQKESDQSQFLSCQFCDNKFALLRELMMHKKRQHGEKLNICWNYANGKCEFWDEKCWFLHMDGSENKFECTACDKTFVIKDKFVNHKKKHHKESVQTCRNVVSGSCRYGSEKCWFDHGDTTKDESNEKVNIEVIEKLFLMMEKFTQQLMEMKETNNLK